MTDSRVADLGAMIVRELPPERVREHARYLASHLDELWVVEDCFYAGGISQLGSVLDATEEISVGHGIAPAPFRNPAALAMEWATLARLHPGRLQCGVGHGVAEWMRQVGALWESPVALLRETTGAVRKLLRGETVTDAGDLVVLDGVRLEYPPVVPPPVSLGVRGPVSLRLAGEIADGAILSEWSSPEYVRWARAQIDEGRRLGRLPIPYRLTVFVAFCFTDEPTGLAAALGAAEVVRNQSDILRIIWPGRRDGDDVPSIQDLLAAGLATGSGTDIAAHLRSLSEAGADALVLVPIGDPISQLDRAIDEILPLWPRSH